MATPKNQIEEAMYMAEYLADRELDPAQGKLCRIEMLLLALGDEAARLGDLAEMVMIAELVGIQSGLTEQRQHLGTLARTLELHDQSTAHQEVLCMLRKTKHMLSGVQKVHSFTRRVSRFTMMYARDLPPAWQAFAYDETPDSK